MKVCIFTLGCKVNQYESDSIARALLANGIEVSEELEPADLYILNTCAVTTEAERKSRQLVARVRKLNEGAQIYVTGCASQHMPKAFENKRVTYTNGITGKNKLIDNFGVLNGVEIQPTGKDFEELYRDGCAYRVSERIREYIKIQDGCNRFCSYCIIPFLRGRSRSRSVESVVREVFASSAPEIVITGIDLSDYNGKNGLTELIKRLADTDKRIRLGSLEASVIDENLLAACKSIKGFCPHFHLSLQSGSDKVLADMNRHYTTAEFRGKVDLIRSVFPSAAITTDIIVGYPTETAEDFANSLAFAREVGFADIHVFPFSPREGTRAAKLKLLLPSTVAVRVTAMTALKNQLTKAFSEQNIGQSAKVLVERKQNGKCEGYSENYIRVYFADGNVGDIISVSNEKLYKDGLFARKEQ